MVDVGVDVSRELERVDREIRDLPAWLPGAALSIDGGLNRHPMPSETALPLLETARAAAVDLACGRLRAGARPGASDGNFTGALGIPTLDGLGAVGGGRTRGEYVDVGMMANRAALLAGLIERLRPGSPRS